MIYGSAAPIREGEERAREAYEAYTSSIGWKDQEEKILAWHQLPVEVQDAWIEAADAAVRYCKGWG